MHLIIMYSFVFDVIENNLFCFSTDNLRISLCDGQKEKTMTVYTTQIEDTKSKYNLCIHIYRDSDSLYSWVAYNKGWNNWIRKGTHKYGFLIDWYSLTSGTDLYGNLKKTGEYNVTITIDSDVTAGVHVLYFYKNNPNVFVTVTLKVSKGKLF